MLVCVATLNFLLASGIRSQETFNEDFESTFGNSCCDGVGFSCAYHGRGLLNCVGSSCTLGFECLPSCTRLLEIGGGANIEPARMGIKSGGRCLMSCRFLFFERSTGQGEVVLSGGNPRRLDRKELSGACGSGRHYGFPMALRAASATSLGMFSS